MVIFFYLYLFPGYGVVLLQFLKPLTCNLTLFLIGLKYICHSVSLMWPSFDFEKS